MNDWKFICSRAEGQSIELNGLNIWDYEWKSIEEKVIITDPLYSQPHTLRVYQVTNELTTIEFGAVEFSNGIWGIYQRIGTIS